MNNKGFIVGAILLVLVILVVSLILPSELDINLSSGSSGSGYLLDCSSSVVGDSISCAGVRLSSNRVGCCPDVGSDSCLNDPDEYGNPYCGGPKLSCSSGSNLCIGEGIYARSYVCCADTDYETDCTTDGLGRPSCVSLPAINFVSTHCENSGAISTICKGTGKWDRVAQCCYGSDGCTITPSTAGTNNAGFPVCSSDSASSAYIFDLSCSVGEDICFGTGVYAKQFRCCDSTGYTTQNACTTISSGEPVCAPRMNNASSTCSSSLIVGAGSYSNEAVCASSGNRISNQSSSIAGKPYGAPVASLSCGSGESMCLGTGSYNYLTACCSSGAYCTITPSGVPGCD